MTGLPDRRRRRGAILAAVGIVIALAGLGFVGRTLVTNWPETRRLLGDAEVVWVVAAFPLGLAAMTTIGLAWRRAIRLVGADAGRRETLSWYFPGQLGKYVPGGLWPVVGRSELGVRDGLPRAAAYSSVGLSLATTYLAAVLTGLVLLPFAVVDLTGGTRPVWVMALLPLGLVALHPAVLQRLVQVGERVLGRAIEVRVPPYRDVVVLVVAHVPAWLLVGIATWFVARAFDASAPLTGVLFATSLSWVAGFVVIGVPGGIGVREAMFASVLGASVTAGVAASTALTARLLFVLVDVTGAVTVTALRRRRTRTTATVTASTED